MSRVVITKQVTLPATTQQIARTLHAGEVVELNATDLAAVTANGGTLRPASTTAGGQTMRDVLGECWGVSNGNPVG